SNLGFRPALARLAQSTIFSFHYLRTGAYKSESSQASSGPGVSDFKVQIESRFHFTAKLEIKVKILSYEDI
ncbi:MAG TPA: hypothetical protein VMW89_08875, partial [Desulfatiglandales bacterium]|nr:hypothetical protein [Desulfatiglandales bacterium]